MKKNLFTIVLVILSCVFVVLTVTALSAQRATPPPPPKSMDAQLEKAAYYLLDKTGPPKDCKKGFYFAMDAIVHLTSQTPSCAAEHQQLSKANLLFKANGIYDKQGGQLLRDAYKTLNSGKPFQLPELESIPQAVEICKKKFTVARKAIKNTQHKTAAKELTETLIIIITPMHKK